MILLAGPGPILVNGDGWFTSAISLPFFECVIDPTTSERIESPDLATLPLGNPLSKFLQFPVDLQIITSFDIWISSRAFPKSEKSFKSDSDPVPKERFQILISELFFIAVLIFMTSSSSSILSFFSSGNTVASKSLHPELPVQFWPSNSSP